MQLWITTPSCHFHRAKTQGVMMLMALKFPLPYWHIPFTQLYFIIWHSTIQDLTFELPPPSPAIITTLPTNIMNAWMCSLMPCLVLFFLWKDEKLKNPNLIGIFMPRNAVGCACQIKNQKAQHENNYFLQSCTWQ